MAAQTRRRLVKQNASRSASKIAILATHSSRILTTAPYQGSFMRLGTTSRCNTHQLLQALAIRTGWTIGLVVGGVEMLETYHKEVEGSQILLIFRLLTSRISLPSA